MSELQAIYETGTVAGGAQAEWEQAAGDWLANLKAEQTRRA